MKQLIKLSSFISLILLFSLASCVTNEVTKVDLSKSSVAIKVGQSDSLDITVTITGDLPEQPVTWTASSPDIVSIAEGVSQSQSKNGSSYIKNIVLTAVKVGSTTITFKAGNKTATCEITIDQINYMFNRAYISNFGDYYDIGTNNFDMYLLQNSLSVDTAGSVSGNGTMLYLEFNVPITQDAITEGSFTLTDTGAANTFIPGQIVESQGQSITIGSHFVTFNDTGSSSILIIDGHYTITAKGNNFLIEGDLVTENNEVIHFSYEGLAPVSDQREVPVEIYPNMTKGELWYFGDAYNSGYSNNFVAYLGNDQVNFEDSVLTGEILVLEFNTPLTVTDSIPQGTYNMVTKLTVVEDLAPYSLVFGYTTSNNNNWGCWYYSDTTIKKLKTGNMVVSKSGDQYTINYQMFDRFGSKVSGTFTGPLKYIDGTNSSSSVSASHVKSNNQTVKSFSKLLNKISKIKTFRFHK